MKKADLSSAGRHKEECIQSKARIPPSVPRIYPWFSQQPEISSG